MGLRRQITGPCKLRSVGLSVGRQRCMSTIKQTFFRHAKRTSLTAQIAVFSPAAPLSPYVFAVMFGTQEAACQSCANTALPEKVLI